MLTTALLAYLAAFICYFVQWTFGQPMIDQPLGVGLVAGCAPGYFHRKRQRGRCDFG